MNDGEEIFKNFLITIWSIAEHIFKISAWGLFVIGFSVVISKNSPQYIWIAYALGFVWFLALMSILSRAIGVLVLTKLKSRHFYVYIFFHFLASITVPVLIFLKIYPLIYEVFSVIYLSMLSK
jgi:hypothetical protein